MSWQRTNVQAAASYLRERIATQSSDVRAKIVYEGLLDVLDPSRRTARLQREAATATKASVTVQAARERRNQSDRRGVDRRQTAGLPPGGIERRKGDRRRGNRRT